jgi:hypothetical protein
LHFGDSAPSFQGNLTNREKSVDEHKEKIRQRAYEIWEQEGRPHGEDLKHWLKAFEEIGTRAEKKARKPRSAKGKSAGSATESPSLRSAAPAKSNAKPARNAAGKSTRH